MRCGQQAGQQRRIGAQRQHEDRRGRQIEKRVEIGRLAGLVGVDGAEEIGDRLQEGQHHGAADEAVDQIADGQALGGPVFPVALQNRIDGAAEIGAQHQGQSCDRASRNANS